jgi:hypothetical protein
LALGPRTAAIERGKGTRTALGQKDRNRQSCKLTMLGDCYQLLQCCA